MRRIGAGNGEGKRIKGKVVKDYEDLNLLVSGIKDIVVRKIKDAEERAIDEEKSLRWRWGPELGGRESSQEHRKGITLTGRRTIWKSRWGGKCREYYGIYFLR